ncbi:MAG TPA: dihydroorotase [Bacteroidia bacterium]|jgi:dihydroorotase|nr:dihydroorotase [Bacteroidia bacterium]
MKLLIQQARISDPNSGHNGKVCDILIENGIIVSIQAKIEAGKDIKTFSAENLHVSPGWFDMQSNFRDPGFEYKEDIASGASAAAAGGFTGVALMPSTQPPIHSKAEVEYIRNKSRGSAVDIYPIGTLSQHLEGKELSEMYDMHLSGAVAFSDDKKPVKNAGLLLRALLYTKNFNRLVMTHCDEQSISGEGKMNEGVMSTQLGLKGMPALAEEVMLNRNIHLAQYADARLHISSVSTAGAVEQIRTAKKQGMKLSASVNAHHLALDDKTLGGFDTNLKVNPPLRTGADIAALKKGLADGTIDVIVSDHAPEDPENKVLEFDMAAFGMLGLETAYAIANTYSGLKTEDLIHKLSIAPRTLLGIEIPKIKEGEKANLSFFNPDLKWTFGEKDIRSKSRNTPFTGHAFKGKALGIYNQGEIRS